MFETRMIQIYDKYFSPITISMSNAHAKIGNTEMHQYNELVTIVTTSKKKTHGMTYNIKMNKYWWC